MTDTKLKDVCHTVDFGRAACGFVCLCVFTKVPGNVRSASITLLLDDSRKVACIQCRVPRFSFRPSDRDMPCHGLGSANTQPVVKYRVDPSTSRIEVTQNGLKRKLKTAKFTCNLFFLLSILFCVTSVSFLLSLCILIGFFFFILSSG